MLNCSKKVPLIKQKSTRHSSINSYKSNSFLNSAIVSSGLVTLWPTVRGSSKIS
jgi:hypothetical protein